MRGHAHRRHPGPRRGQPRRARARARSWAALTDLDCSNEAFAYLDGKRAPVAGVPCAAPAHRLRRRGRLRDPLPRRPRRSTCGTRSSRPAPSTGSARSASSPSASCACRSCTSSSARTPTRSRRPTARRCRGSSSSTRTRTSSASGRSSTPPSIRARDRARRLHAARRRRADRGRRGARRARRAGRAGHERAPLAASSGSVIGMAWVPADAGQRRRRDHDLRRRPRACAPRS